jgi:cytoskeletal protein RodZ
MARKTPRKAVKKVAKKVVAKRPVAKKAPAKKVVRKALALNGPPLTLEEAQALARVRRPVRTTRRAAAAAAPTATPATASGATAATTQQQTGAQVLAAPTTGVAVDATPGELVLAFRGDSWIEVLGPDGVAVERGLVAAGSTRHFVPAAVGVVTLGDATVVEVSRDGLVLDTGTLDAAKRARFTVSSDGSIHPSAID